jgi:ferritin-like metal-binding protein YciE
MTLGTLQDLYRTELDDLYDAEKQIVAALPKLSTAAANPELKAAFDKHLERSRVHIERLDVILKKLGASPTGTRSAAIEALIREGDKRIQLATDPDTRDAALIAAAQRVEHYEIAGYGCARTYARQLNDEHAADLLQQTLDEEGSADHELTRIAELGINQAARQGETLDSQVAARLRYVDADDFETDAFDPSDIHVRSRDDEDLGHLDGFVVDESGRPYYYVVDSGGWFIGRRYMLPVGKATLDPARQAMLADVTKDTFKRYPEFHTSGFMAMSDDEARRYEWRVLEAIDPNAARRQRSSAVVYEEYDYYRVPSWLGTGEAGAGDRGISSAARGSQTAATSRPTSERERVGSRDREQVTARERTGERKTPPKPGEDIR